MTTTNDSLVSAARDPAREDPGWHDLPHGRLTNRIIGAHRAQVLNYLRASGLEVGLVVNFGSSVQFKRVVLSRNLQQQDLTRI